MQAKKTNWICLCLLFLMIVKSGIMPAICLDYELRKEYIIKNICVNRNRPQLHCDGKCYLAKKLAESQKQEEQAAGKGYLASLIYQVMNTGGQPAFRLAPVFYPVSKEKVLFDYTSPFLATTVFNKVFRPPLTFIHTSLV